jgi:hypothetical protein
MTLLKVLSWNLLGDSDENNEDHIREAANQTVEI